MKRAVSISIGSSKRNKAVEVTLLGEKVSIERIGTDGDMEAAALKYKDLDGTVDAFGVGGADLGAIIDGKWYTLHSVTPMVRFVKKTPLVDGGGLKNTLENQAPAFLDQKIGDYINSRGRKVLVVGGARPIAAPPPTDRRERTHDEIVVVDRAFPLLRAVCVLRTFGRIDTTGVDPRVHERVDVDRGAVRML